VFEKCFEYIFLGLIQGLTEFIPISSTAHLKIVPILFGFPDPGVSISAFLQLGSIFAVVFYFKKEINLVLINLIGKTISNKKNDLDYKNLGLKIILGTIPILLIGFIFKIYWSDYTDSFLRSSHSIGIVSILMACLMYFSIKFSNQKKNLLELDFSNSFLVGLSQSLALIPGVSRSGITLSSILLCGLRKEEAAKFSFLLGIPSITIAGIAEFSSLMISNTQIDLFPLFLGFISSAIFSLLSIDLFIKFLKYNGLGPFIFYRLVFGTFLLLSNSF
tara:strand:- start:306 stop:1130 length:825 start_codon:yes stop_codon:yes gene_type:complete